MNETLESVMFVNGALWVKGTEFDRGMVDTYTIILYKNNIKMTLPKGNLLCWRSEVNQGQEEFKKAIV